MSLMMSRWPGRCWPLLLAGATAWAQDPSATLSPVEVRSQVENLEGLATSGSEGVVSAHRLAAVPLLRPGEVLEMVPGLVVTQHAGDGKANQYFLRGFNLDHGTDFATWVGGVPVNMPSHAHGQGYTDLNFLIPELVDRVHYRKGPYDAQDGDFSSAGVVDIQYLRRLDAGLAQVTLGQGAYARTLLAGSPAAPAGQWLYGLELFHHNGPWQVPKHYRKLNGVLRYSQGSAEHGWSVTGMSYRGRWTSTDQLPQRAIDQGLVSRWGSMDLSTGGLTHRHSLVADWAQQGRDRQTRASVWLLQSGLDLWSNFQYCENDLAATGGCATGDQFQQSERRRAGGFSASHTGLQTWGERPVLWTVGVQGRADLLQPVGLSLSAGRQPWATVREDRVQQRSLAVWLQQDLRWTEQWRTVLGLRADHYRFAVQAHQPANSGRSHDQMLSPKLALIWSPRANTEVYLNHGLGFHSNDARGTTITVDPTDPSQAAERVPALVRTRGVELGLRTQPLPGWHSTLAFWRLGTASELLFVGDAGTTEASRPARRHGVEWTHFYAINRWLSLDADLAWSWARFRDAAPEGSRIPGAVTTTANLGVSVAGLGPWSGALRLRWFGPRPLVEDNSVRSAGSALLNLRVAYRLSPQSQWSLEVYNLLNRRLNDIEYLYSSQLAHEAAPVLDRHLHPTEPRRLRVTFSHRF